MSITGANISIIKFFNTNVKTLQINVKTLQVNIKFFYFNERILHFNIKFFSGQNKNFTHQCGDRTLICSEDLRHIEKLKQQPKKFFFFQKILIKQGEHFKIVFIQSTNSLT
jgi:hypothetical protein